MDGKEVLFMRKKLLLIGIMALAAGLSPGASALDVPLKYEKMPAALDPNAFFPYGGGGVLATSVKPAGDWKLPPLITDKPYYALFTLGDKKHLLVTDKKNIGEKFFTRIFFDCNGNGDMTDDKPIDGTVQDGGGAPPGDGYFNVEYPQIDVTITADGAQLPYSVKLYLYGQMQSGGVTEVHISFMVACAYRGEFTVGGSRYSFWLCDRDGNGRFTDHAKIPDRKDAPAHASMYPEGDLIYLTDGRKLNYNDGLSLGDLLLVGGALFEARIEPSKGKMTLTEIRNGLSPLKLPIKPERLSLFTVDGNHCLMAYKPAGDVIMLPAGKYRLMEYHLFRKDAQGDLWRLYAMGTKETPATAVAPNSGAVLPFGEPYVPVVDLPRGDYPPGAGGERTYLTFNVTGAGGEVLTGLTRLEGTATRIPLSKTRGRENYPKEPAYTIVKPDGEIVAKGSFEYG
jgi:hypothetical protein